MNKKLLHFKRLPQTFFRQNLLDFAQNLLNKFLIIKTQHKTGISQIVEVEAYSHADQGSHSFLNKKTPRNTSMFLERGHLYVYIIHGLYHCLNIVTGPAGQGDAVLIRAVKPINYVGKTNGPGNLCQTLQITKKYDKIDIKKSPHIYLATNATNNKKLYGDFKFIRQNDYCALWENNHDQQLIVATRRINIDYAGEDKHLFGRFYIKDDVNVSKKLSRKWL